MDETLARILDLMQQQKIPETEMQTTIGVPKGSFSNWKSDKGHSYYQHIDQIADRLGVTIDYLIRGHEKIGGAMTEAELELINDYRKLTTEGQKIIAANIKLIVSNYDCSQKV